MSSDEVSTRVDTQHVPYDCQDQLESGLLASEKFYERQFLNSRYAPYTCASDHPYSTLLASFVRNHGLLAKRCLEVGCGRGAFEGMVDRYVGVDIAAGAGRNMHKPFVCASAANLPFRADSFDAAWTITVLEHVPNPERALSEMRRVLRPGGVLLLAPAWFTRPWFADGLPVRSYRDLTWCQKFRKLSIPFRNNAAVRYPHIFARRMLRLAKWLMGGKTIPFRYRPLKANYERYWMSDSDAVNSMDPFDVILWFVSRGGHLPHRDEASALAALPRAGFGVPHPQE